MPTPSLQLANLQLPDDGVTIVVISNDDQNDVESAAVHLAGIVVPKVVARVRPTKRTIATIRVPAVFGLPSGDNSALWVGGQQGVVTRIDPRANKVAATIKINDPTTRPGLIDAGIVQVATGSGQVWVSDRVNKTVVRIDPATNKVVARLPVGIEPFGLAIAGDTLWVGDSHEDEPGVNTFVRIDLRSQKVVARITNATTSLGEPFLVMAATPDALWYADWQVGTIKRLNPATNKVVASINAGLQPSSVVVGDGAVWTANHFSNQVTRIDPATDKMIASILLNGYPSSVGLSADCCGNIVVGAGGVWTIAGSANRTLVRIDSQTNRVTASFTFSHGIGPIAFASGSVWVEVQGDLLYRIDPAAMTGS